MIDFDRTKGLGASDCAVALGLSKWSTPLDLYYEKRGENLVEFEPSIPMRCGNALEDLVLELFTEETGQEVTRQQERIFDEVHPWRWATVDGVTEDGWLVEAKTTSVSTGWGDGDTEIPIYYMMQVQHQMAVTGAPGCRLPVLIGNRDFRVYEIERDEELIEMLTEQEADFWQGVVEGTPPDPITKEDVKRLYPVDDGTELLASEEVEERVAQSKKLKLEIKDREEELAVHLQSIRVLLGQHARLVSSEGKLLATLKTSKPRKRFDANKFKFDNPELHGSYITESPGTRSLLIK